MSARLDILWLIKNFPFSCNQQMPKIVCLKVEWFIFLPILKKPHIKFISWPVVVMSLQKVYGRHFVPKQVVVPLYQAILY